MAGSKSVAMARARRLLLALILLMGAGCSRSPHYLTGRFDTALSANITLADVSVAEKLPSPAVDFASMLSMRLQRAGLKAATKDSRWDLRAKVTRLDELTLGADIDATARVVYTLTDRLRGAVVLEKAVTSRYQANPSDTGFVFTRKRLAYEGALDNNITLFLDALAQFRSGG